MTEVHAHLTQDAQYFEYAKAANPIGAGLISKIPSASFPGRLHERTLDIRFVHEQQESHVPVE